MKEEDRARVAEIQSEISVLREIQRQREDQIVHIMKKASVDPDLMFFYGKGCQFTGKVEPAIAQLEIHLGKKVDRLETWHDTDNQKKYETVGGPGSCGGVPFFYNQATKESLCGAHSLELLKAWAAAKKK